MQYQTLGKSPLSVSRLCLGAMMFGDQTDATESGRIVASARELGVNFIDTADVYKTGASEVIVGGLIKAERHHWVLASKLGNVMSKAPNEGGYSRAWMLREVEASLTRLQTGHIDILYLHRDFHGLDLEEPLRALTSCNARARFAIGASATFAAGASAKRCTWPANSACQAPACASLTTTC